MPNIEVRGYSERGMINAMMYEMNYSSNGIEMLRNFLKLCVFPNEDPDFENFNSARVLIEQSFSDFGDLDLLIMLDGSIKQSVLLEAKVKTFQSNGWSISDEWDNFKQVVDGTLPKAEDGSNLFIQLYRKMRLINTIKNPNLKLQPNIIGDRWSLGKNRIVIKAAEELAQYSSKPWFLALVPDSQKNIADFFKNKLSNLPTVLPDWSILNVGYLAWEDFENYCKNSPNEWINTLSNFSYNHGQISNPNHVNPITLAPHQSTKAQSGKLTFEEMLKSCTQLQAEYIRQFKKSWEESSEFTIVMGTQGFSAKVDNKHVVWVFPDRIQIRTNKDFTYIHDELVKRLKGHFPETTEKNAKLGEDDLKNLDNLTSFINDIKSIINEAKKVNVKDHQN